MADRGGLDKRRSLHPQTIVAALNEHQVAYVVVGGLAAIAHGSQRVTRDFDIVVDRRARNCRRLIAALVSLQAVIQLPGRKRFSRLSPKADPKWMAAENRFFDTAAGGVDVWNRAEGMPDWKQATASAVEVEAFGESFLVLGKDLLIRAKLAAGRAKDLADVAELTEEPAP
jgi:hypothetical protein